MAGSINSGYNPNAVGVPVSKYISNAQHSGAAQQTGKATTQVKADPAPETVSEAQVETPTPVQPQPAAPEIAGLQSKAQADGGQQLIADSGVSVSTDKDGKINNIEVPGDGAIQRQPDGKMLLVTADGQQVPVAPFESEEGGFAGYAFTRKDDTQVHVNLENMSIGYISKDNNVWQEVQADGSQVIRCKSDFKDPKTGERKQLESEVFVHPDGSVESGGYNRDLQVSAGKIQYKSPANFTHTIDLPNPIASLAGPQETPKAADTPPPVQGPLLMDEPGAKPAAHCVLPSQVGFDRDEKGQTAIMLRSGLTLIYTDDNAAVRDPKVSDKLLPAEVENYKSADGRIEKAFKFKDSGGNQYRMFNESMDFLVDSPDGKVRQHILPSGTILGQVEGGDGKKYKFEVTPRGDVKTDAGLVIPPSAADKGTAYVTGADGKPVAINLPYPIPSDQANAGQYADMYGTFNYPQSGSVLDSFLKPPGQQQPPPAQQQPPPGQQQPPPMGNTPPPMPPNANNGFGPGPMPGGGNYGPEPSVFPNPGMPQQPVPPSFMQRLKYMFTGNPADVQPRNYFQPPPPWMTSYPGSYGFPNGYQQPNVGYPQQNMGSMQPNMGYPQQNPGSMQPNTGYQPGFPPQGYGPYGNPNQPYGQPPQYGGQPPQGPPAGPPPGNSGPSYPGQGPAGPGFSGQTPGYPGQMPNGPGMLEQMRLEFERNNQQMWNQVAMGNVTTQGMIAGQTMNSMFLGANMTMAMWPRSSFFCPFMF